MAKKVISREYKVMLKAERFVGPESSVMQQAGVFWDAFKGVMSELVLDIDGRLNKIGKQRLVRFYDTAGCRLRENSYVFRERVDLLAENREVVLKYRHPDRYISQARDMSAADQSKGKTKFEEDIKHPFYKLYSFSTKQSVSKDKVLNRLNDPGKLYPDLQEKLDRYQGDEPIEIVGDFTAKEVVIVGGDFQIRNSPKEEAECALVLWYDASGDKETPVVAEFSFRYQNKDEAYSGKAAQRAYEVFSRIPERLGPWIDVTGPTKTAYVYSRAA